MIFFIDITDNFSVFPAESDADYMLEFPIVDNLKNVVKIPSKLPALTSFTLEFWVQLGEEVGSVPIVSLQRPGQGLLESDMNFLLTKELKWKFAIQANR